ncbi:hypothetical protein IAR55_005685 [Kwoniella newhampshirensis]|uniref:mRNA-capping enzyme subunit beta n=1 Tax=Kwoniella newhampshirensis TaxID=1651941 RepID=A0AAW0YJI6_9TREE
MPPYIPHHDRSPPHRQFPPGQSPTPRYASPDSDPTIPHNWTREGLFRMSSDSGDGYEDQRPGSSLSLRSGAVNGNGNGSYVPRQRGVVEEEAGPSKKRPRQEEEGHYNQQYEQAPTHQTRQVMPLTGSIFNILPRNPFTSVVGDFIMASASGLSDVEIEIKLGTIMSAPDPTGSQPPRRIRMPTQSEMIMPPDYPLGPFHSTMHPHQYRVFNNLLNSATQTSITLPPHAGRVHFSRSKLTDSFHGNGGRSGKLRVSRDRETGEVVHVVRKRRVADMNVFCPGSPFDWRISVNVEEPCEMPTGPPTMTRDKDRACYRHQVCQVDLTHVKSGDTNHPSSKPTSSFELEIEVLDVPTLLQEGAAGSDRFDEILQNVLDTARMLVKNAEPAPV